MRRGERQTLTLQLETGVRRIISAEITDWHQSDLLLQAVWCRATQVFEVDGDVSYLEIMISVFAIISLDPASCLL